MPRVLPRRHPRRLRGFTMIELVVVMAVLGLLLSIAVPRYLDSLDRGREHVLEHNLAQMRTAIDHYYGDRGAYPDSLEDLVTHRYLRAVPLNPFTDTAEWDVIAPTSGARGAVFDVAEPTGTRPVRRLVIESAPAPSDAASAPDPNAPSSGDGTVP